MDIGSRIKHKREELNMTQEELALKVGYKSKSSINKIEIDGRGLPQSKIQAFAQALNTTPAYLLGWNEEKTEDGIIYVSKDREHTLKAIAELNAADFEFVQEFLQRIKK